MDFPFFVQVPPTVHICMEELKSKIDQRNSSPSSSSPSSPPSSLTSASETQPLPAPSPPSLQPCSSNPLQPSPSPSVSYSSTSPSFHLTPSSFSYIPLPSSSPPSSASSCPPSNLLPSGTPLVPPDPSFCSYSPVSPSPIGEVPSVELRPITQQETIRESETGRKFKSNRMVVFVNKTSGNRKGAQLLKLLRLRLGPDAKIIDVADAQPKEVLEEVNREEIERNGGRRRNKRLLVLACGGDGTVYSVIQGIFESKIRPTPKLGIIPIGTGNDTSREFGWGKTFDPATDDLDAFLWRIRMADVRPVDIWKVSVFPLVDGHQVSEEPEQVIYSCNYFNIGLDAACSLRFDEGRKEHPHLFSTRVGKTLWYMYYGLKSFGKSVSWNLSQDLKYLEIDGKPVDLPKEAKTLVFLNFRSYQNGVDIWWDEAEEEGEEVEGEEEGEGEEKHRGEHRKKLAKKVKKGVRKLKELGHHDKYTDTDSDEDEEERGDKEAGEGKWKEEEEEEEEEEDLVPQSSSDRSIEVCILEGLFHETLVRSGLNHAKRVGQGSKIVMETRVGGSTVAVDGEAQRLPSPSRIVIECARQLPILKPPTLVQVPASVSPTASASSSPVREKREKRKGEGGSTTPTNVMAR